MDNRGFFGLAVDPNSLGGQALGLALALLLGGLIGIEREWRGQAAGLRTHIIVCVGSALITITSVHIAADGLASTGRGDPARLAAQIVSGIGFLGAGAILREGMSVHGLTTAASIWTTAGIGIAVGAGPRLGALALISTLIVLATLTILNVLERTLKFKHAVHFLELEVREANDGPAHVLALLGSMGCDIYGLTQGSGPAGSDARQSTRRLQYKLRLPMSFDRQRFHSALLAEESVLSYHLD